MAKAMICDRCGNTFYENKKGDVNSIIVVYRRWDDMMPVRNEQRKDYDICPDCIKAFNVFMGEEEENDEQPAE